MSAWWSALSESVTLVTDYALARSPATRIRRTGGCTRGWVLTGR